MADFAENPQNVEADKAGLEDSEISTNWDECTTTFDSMDLKEDLLRGIYAYGFEKPSAIQQVLTFLFFYEYSFCAGVSLLVSVFKAGDLLAHSLSFSARELSSLPLWAEM